MSELSEIGLLKEQIRLQTSLDQYTSDLISTLQELLEAKDTLIADLRGQINK